MNGEAAWPRAILSLGGNIGDVINSFDKALTDLRRREDCAVAHVSSVWRTRPWGKKDQPDFLNMVAVIRTRLTPKQLLDLCQLLERQAGRARGARWGPRTLDIDIIDFDGQAMKTDILELPHPRAHERLFVLAPLAEVAPDVLLEGRKVSRHLADLRPELAAGGALVDVAETRKLKQNQ